MLVSIVILNYNCEKYLDKLLSSILTDKNPFNTEIIIIDNRSRDNSIEIIKDYIKKYGHEHSIRLLINKTNLGYGKAMNQGLGLARGKYVAFLNCDLYCESGWLKYIVETFRSNPRIAIVQPLIYDYDDKTKVQSYGLYCDLACNFKSSNGRSPVILAPFGAAFVVRRDVFQMIGGFDPDFFLYGEEIDVGLRIWMAGYMVVLEPRAKVFHKGGGSTSRSAYFKYVYHYNARKNQLQTLLKALSTRNLILSLSIVTFINILRLVRSIIKKEKVIAVSIIHAYLYLIREMRYLIVKRRKFLKIKRLSEEFLRKNGLIRPFLS